MANVSSSTYRHALAGSLVGVLLSLGCISSKAIALTPVAPLPDMRLLNASNSIPVDPSIVTADTIHQSRLTIPSLWWAQAQFGGKLVQNWAAYPAHDGVRPRVDLVVNRQIWSLLSYLERYTFLSHFGTAARDFGYSTRVFNQQGEALAAYICRFPENITATPEDGVADQPPSDSTDSSAPHGAAGGGDAASDRLAENAPENVPDERIAESSIHLTQESDRPDQMPDCSVDLDSSGAGAFRGRSSSFGEF
jgi:hypothetical protein